MTRPPAKPIGLKVEAMTSAEIDIETVCPLKTPTFPPGTHEYDPKRHSLIEGVSKCMITREEAQVKFKEHHDAQGPHDEVYTDLSKIDERVGAAAVINRQFQNGETTCRQLSKRLPNNSTIFAAEATAITLIDTDNPLICQIMNLLLALSDKGTCVRFCWVPSHCGIEGNEIVDQLAKQTLDHDIDPLTTVHFADLKPLVNSYIQQEVQIKWDVSIHGRDLYLLKPTLGPPQRFRHLTRAEEVVITPTTSWPYQGHKIPYLVSRTTNCLPALWPASDNWAHTPGMYSVATKSWWVLHSWFIEDTLWDDPGGLHNRISERSWIVLSDMNGQISNTTLYQISHQLTTFSSWINPHYWTPPLEVVYRA